MPARLRSSRSIISLKTSRHQSLTQPSRRNQSSRIERRRQREGAAVPRVGRRGREVGLLSTNSIGLVSSARTSRYVVAVLVRLVELGEIGRAPSWSGRGSSRRRAPRGTAESGIQTRSNISTMRLTIDGVGFRQLAVVVAAPHDDRHRVVVQLPLRIVIETPVLRHRRRLRHDEAEVEELDAAARNDRDDRGKSVSSLSGMTVDTNS